MECPKIEIFQIQQPTNVIYFHKMSIKQMLKYSWHLTALKRSEYNSTKIRLAPSLKWSRGPTKSRSSRETGTLCRESHSAVSILETAMIAAIIGIIDYTAITGMFSHL